MANRYLVTGCAGFIGRSISAALLARGESVRGIDNFSTGKRENLDSLDGIDFIAGDITDAATCAEACRGITHIFHEAAIPSVPRSVEDPAGSNHANVTGTVTLLDAARQSGVQRIVYAASSSAYGNTPTLPKREDMLPRPLSPYAVAKLAGEYYMQAFANVYGLETVCLRYFNVFGPHQDPTSMYSGVLARFTMQMLAGETPTVFGDGEQSRDFTFIENVVAGNLLAASALAERVSGNVYNVATGSRITLNDAVETLQTLTGYNGEVRHAEDRRGDVKHSLADISAAKRDLGYVPLVTFAEGMAKTTDWYRSTMPQLVSA